MSDYPECEKLKAISEKSNLIGQFISESEYSLCVWDEQHGRYWPARGSLEEILAEYFDIDMKKVETERAALLESLR